MEQQDQKTMETLLDLFNHEGWTIFIDDQDKISKYLKEQAYRECNTNDEWQQRRGALVTLDRIISYADTIKYVYEHKDDDDDS